MNKQNKYDEFDLLYEAMFIGYDMQNNINHIDSFKDVNKNVMNSRTAAGWIYSAVSNDREINEEKYIEQYVESTKGYESEEEYLKNYPFPEFYTVLGKKLYKECEAISAKFGNSAIHLSPLITEKTTEAYINAKALILFDWKVDKEFVRQFLSLTQFFDTEEEFLSFLEEHSLENSSGKTPSTEKFIFR